ncbi:Protein bric-a-brac 2, partial [Stegodyphus mimosarum]
MFTMFESLKSMENFVDVTLACEGRLIKAHKLILSAGSKFFHNLFITNPCKHPIIVMHDIKYNVLKAIIEFMYKGEIYVTHDHLQVLLKTAKTLDVKGLAEIWKDSNRTENPDSQETSHSSTTMSSMTVPPESPPSSHKKKRIRLRKQSFDSSFSNDEIVPKIEESTSPESQEPIDFVSNIGDSSNLLPNNMLTIPRPIKRFSSSSKPVSVPVCEELEVDPVTDHDYNMESFKEEQTSLTSEQV